MGCAGLGVTHFNPKGCGALPGGPHASLQGVRIDARNW